MFFHARTLEDGKKGCPGVMYFHARTFEDGKKGCPGYCIYMLNHLKMVRKPIILFYMIKNH